PGGLGRAAVHELQAQRVRAGQQDDGAFRAPGEGRAREQPHDGTGGFHARASLIGVADGSARRIGRSTFDWFCFFGSSPSARHPVAIRSGTLTGRSSTAEPSLLVRPTTCPPATPPPPSTTLHAAG